MSIDYLFFIIAKKEKEGIRKVDFFGRAVVQLFCSSCVTHLYKITLLSFYSLLPFLCKKINALRDLQSRSTILLLLAMCNNYVAKGNRIKLRDYKSRRATS